MYRTTEQLHPELLLSRRRGLPYIARSLRLVTLELVLRSLKADLSRNDRPTVQSRWHPILPSGTVTVSPLASMLQQE
jgi:hypothetical protein